MEDVKEEEKVRRELKQNQLDIASKGKEMVYDDSSLGFPV